MLTKNYIIIKDEESNNVIYQGHNLVVLRGRHILQQRMLNIGMYKDYSLTHFGIGNGGTDQNNMLIPIAPTENDTALYNHILYKPLEKKTSLSSTSALVELFLAKEDGTDLFVYTEAGLFASDGVNYELYARITFPAIIKDSSRSQRMYWYLFF